MSLPNNFINLSGLLTILFSSSSVYPIEANIRENSLCCGAGGGVKSAYPEIADQMAQTRINQAKQTGCTTLVTACPFCKLNLENDGMEVLDLCEFLVKYGDADEAE